MTPQSPKRLAQNLAESLSLSVWDKRGIADCLCRRFPPALQRFTQLQTQGLLDHFPTQIAPGRTAVASALAQSSVFARIHRYCVLNSVWPAPDLRAPKMQPLQAFAHLEIPQLATLGDLADWMLLTPQQLDYYADQTGRHEEHGDMAVNHYHYHLSPKIGGGHRLIEAPKPRLKSLQRLILRAILDHILPHPNAYGFVQGRNCIEAAARHVGEKAVVAHDLRDFFSSIQGGRIYGIFRALGYPPNVAHALTGLCTVTTPARIRNRMGFHQRQALRVAHLPQGAPTSPALGNLAAHGLDRRLTGLARSLGATYTRYADDLTFSGDEHIIRAICVAVPDIVSEEGFALNPAKTRLMPSHRRQVVTGIVVNNATNVDRREFDQIKAAIHARAWQTDPALQARLSGQIAWVRQLNPARGAKLERLMARA
ncbi:Reverse transcriptase (RNA-dependent DNA polymerase) [Cognatiyoonia koreensis]|uniref:RNA-directed DNA polymerase n=1 Tax=Cognatiyoonia koreensis TaxID=364200 RepID=A0A1I0MHV9_9RHOB|nr:reverse transcriptase family protein [Cognatiyoonia koreensis]SEV87604.1 Reverse transcriptase (RNA-dependent DNA polymerase) [Cognatiyoonia koreensis]